MQNIWETTIGSKKPTHIITILIKPYLNNALWPLEVSCARPAFRVFLFLFCARIKKRTFLCNHNSSQSRTHIVVLTSRSVDKLRYRHLYFGLGRNEAQGSTPPEGIGQGDTFRLLAILLATRFVAFQVLPSPANGSWQHELIIYPVKNWRKSVERCYQQQ